MKKLLLSALASACLCPAFASLTGFPANLPKASATQLLQSQTSNPLAAKAPAKADELTATCNIRFAGDIYSWMYLKTTRNITCEGMIYVPAEIATKLAGNKLTKVGTSCYLQSATSKTGTVFVREAYDGEDVTSSEVTIKTSTTSLPNGYEYDLEEPYEIKAGQGFYFGFSISGCNGLTAKDYPFGVDSSSGSEYAGIVGYKTTTSDMQYYSMQDQANLVCWAVTEGAISKLENVYVINDYIAGSSALPVYKSTQTPGNFKVTICNLGDNAVTTFDYEITVNGEKTTGTFTGSIAAKKTANANVKAPEIPVGHNTVSMRLTSVNGEQKDINLGQRVIVRNPAEGYFTRKMIVEEATGTWCGWCPRGIVGMDWATENLADFIGIAVHGSDDLSVDSYQDFFYYASGFPSCLINRDYRNLKDPDKSVLNTAYRTFVNQSIGKIDVTAGYDPDKNVIVASSATSFVVDVENNPYRVAYVLLEDGLVDDQTNYYAPAYNQNQTLEGWDDAEAVVETTYYNTARDIFDFTGIENSLPATIHAGNVMNHSAELTLGNVTDPTKTAVVALLIESTTNTILNGAKVAYSEYAGIDAPVADADSEVSVKGADNGIAINGEYTSGAVYDTAGRTVATLSGEKTASLPAGIYIVRINGNATKVVVK